jgi:hypothetical protein
MRQRKPWTHAEDELVRKRMRDAIANGESIRDVAQELSYTLPHPTSSILQRWYSVLSSDDERVKGQRDTRVAWNSRFKPETVALIRAMADVLDMQQNETVEFALQTLAGTLDTATLSQIQARQVELLEAMKE